MKYASGPGNGRRAAQHPSIVAISVAVVAVRWLSVGRGAFRYVERLASHDVAFRVLADVRVAIYRRLELLAPAGLAAFRSGDLLARLTGDVGATQDLFIRGLGPPLAAALAAGGAVTACLLILAPAGGMLAQGPLTVSIAVPFAAVAASGQAERATVRARGELGTTLTDLLRGAAELEAFGAQDTALGAVRAAGRKLTALARRWAVAAGLGSELTTVVAGVTLCSVLGVTAVAEGTLTRVPLAVVTLTAMAAFDGSPCCPRHRTDVPSMRLLEGRAWRSLRPEAMAWTCGCGGVQVRYPPGRSRWTASTLTCRRGGGWRSSAYRRLRRSQTAQAGSPPSLVIPYAALTCQG